jgi:hypothetical protein
MEKRIQELENKLLQLRLSRRVLMLLLEKLDRERTIFSERLEKENRRLLRTNHQYAQSLLQKNRQIFELESKLQSSARQESGR